MKDSLHVICVTYLCDDLSFLRKKLIKAFGLQREVNVIIIDTATILNYKSDQFHDALDVNSFFEFSGYYYGLEYLKANSDCEFFDVMFVNDTIFKSHFLPAYVHTYREFMNSNSYSNVRPYICGVAQYREFGPIIPTCQFFVGLHRNEIKRNIFIPFDKHAKLFVESKHVCTTELYVGSREIYLKRVNDWLNPKSFMGGWYKANPWSSLNINEYNRKYIAIFLEHSFLVRNKEEGFNINPLKKGVFLILLYRIDRIFQNVQKFQMRITFYIRHVCKRF